MDPAKEKEKEVEEEYLSSLMDLNVNSKPLINMLTMLAEDNLECAPVIVRAIEKHLSQVSSDIKLPILYLIDSIVKNVGKKYKQLFAQNIVNIFCSVFEKVNERVREKMFNLRQTWNDVFPQTKLYALDVKVNVMDNNWPITAKVVPKSVHVNPNFLKNPEGQAKEDLLKQMQAKERELLELKQRKIELELMVTKKKIAEQEKEIQKIPHTNAASTSNNHTGHNNPNVSGISMTTASSQGVPQTNHSTGRIRIAPVSSAMITSARSRDPRLLKMRPVNDGIAQQTLSSSVPVIPPEMLMNSNITKSLPRIPKYSSSIINNKTSRDNDERDPRKRREKEAKNDLNSKDKSKSTLSSSKSSSSERKKSGSSSQDSPRKRDDDKKSSKGNSSSSSSHHKSSHSRSQKESTKSPRGSSKSKEDIDLRIHPIGAVSTAIVGDLDMRPDSTTHSKYNKNKLLNELLHDEDIKSSQDTMITTSNNEESKTDQLNQKCDTDLRFVEAGKKRSISNETPLDVEPLTKKTRTETDTLFGSEDVDLRAPPILDIVAPTIEKKNKVKDKADFEAVRAKLNASKARSKATGVKLLDEIPSMPLGAQLESANGNASEIVRKMLQKKKHDAKEIVDNTSILNNDISDRTNEIAPIIPQANLSQPPPKIEVDIKDEIIDYGSMTAAELRKNSAVPANIRKEKRKETKWGQPTMPWIQPNNQSNINMIPLPQHFINPWETNPMVVAMQKQSQMPLVVPQSPSQPILNNKMRTLRLDGTRDHLLRFYGEVAIIFNEGEAHDIRFSSGQSKVIIDDMFSVILEFNDTYKPVMIDGILHQIKFGTPTRELYIDDHFYECYFNNQITQIILGDKVRRVRIEGKAPEVKIGNKRNDIVLGLINMMIDAEIMVPVFLDTTLQYFEYKSQIFTLQFADFFLSVIINNEPFKVEFGGLPKNFVLNGQKHFIRFTALPDELVPGQVNMRGMRRTHLFRNCKSPPLKDIHIDPDTYMRDHNVNINQLVEKDMRHMPMNNNAMNSQMAIENEQQQQQQSNISLPDLNISELLQKLVATGIIGNNASSPPPVVVEEKAEHVDERMNQKPQVQQEEKAKIIPVNLSRPETIKRRQQAVIDTLYCGIQCSSCGLRFPPEQTIKYSQHLDWHFRQNRRERDSKQKANSRKWYYNQSDWIKYEEIEDLDEREKNFFETQQKEAMDQEDSNGMPRTIGNQETLSCPAGPDDSNRFCEMCHDPFKLFFNDETEEWHLTNAVKDEEKFFHPICYEDYKASFTLDETALNEANESNINSEADVEMTEIKDVVVKEERNDAGMQNNQNMDDDDDVIVLPTQEPVITEITDEPGDQLSTDKDENNQTTTTTTTIDDDVMIQEPTIETQIVNDDDDDEPNASASNEIAPLIVKIKEEPKDDGYEDHTAEEDAFIEVTSINEDLMHDDGHTQINSPFQPALDENAVFDLNESSLFSHNSNEDLVDDDNSRHESSSAAPVIGGNKKLKIVLSSLVQNNLTNKNINNSSNVNSEQNDNSNVDSINKLVDSNSNDLQKEGEDRSACDDENKQDDAELPYVLKPSLQGFQFIKNPVPVKRGIENSGLCSIM